MSAKATLRDWFVSLCFSEFQHDPDPLAKRQILREWGTAPIIAAESDPDLPKLRAYVHERWGEVGRVSYWRLRDALCLALDLTEEAAEQLTPSEALAALRPRQSGATETVDASRKAEEVTAWSRPETVEVWATFFGLHRNTMAKLIREGAVRSKPMGSFYMLAIDDLPAQARGKHLSPPK
jgi:hypothetical protein